MLAIEIRLLTGRYAAGRYDNPGEAEWPPHPVRVFSALTAAMYDDPDPPSEDRVALDWLAEAGAPEVIASNASMRQLSDVYVPVNDVKALRDIDLYLDRLSAAEARAANSEGTAAAKAAKKAEKVREKVRERSVATAKADGKGTPSAAVQVVERRPRHPRRFPVAVPEVGVVHLRWSDATAPSAIQDSLDRLCGRVARLGHSSSLVSMRLVETGVEIEGRTRWLPDPSGHHFLRVPLPDQLRLLDEAHAQHGQTEPRILPADPVHYLEAGADGARVVRPHSDFSDRTVEWVTYEVVGPPGGGRRTLLDLSLSQAIARALRGTLLSSLDAGAPATLTGHDRHGQPTSQAHLAFVPLGYVGHAHATGSILGVAMVPPRDLPVQDRDILLEAIFQAERAVGETIEETSTIGSGRTLRLTLGRAGVVYLRRLTEPAERTTLRSARWCRPARRWVSATPVALGRNPGNLRSRDPGVVRRATEAAEATVTDACEHAGLPRPRAVWIHRRSLVVGAAAAERFMPFPDKGSGPKRVCVHTEIVFDEPVLGPVLIGAGRFFGLGLHVPDDRSRPGGGS